ncbi:hypothetical protein FOZ63_024178, partial [Perkinsus olseni]
MKFRGKLTAAGQSALSQVIGHLAKTRGGSSNDRRFTVVNLKISPIEFTLGCSAMDDGSPETWAHLAVECIFDIVECQSLREGNYIDLVASLENLLAASKGLSSSTSTEIRLRNKSGLAVLAFTYTIPQAYDPSVGGQAFVKAFHDVPVTLSQRNPIAVPQLQEADLQFNFEDLEGCRRSIDTLKRAMGNKLDKCKLRVSPSVVGEDGETVKVSVSASSPMTTMSITYSGLPVLPREQEPQDGHDGAPAIRPLSVTVHTRRLLNMTNVSGVKLDTPPVVMVTGREDSCALSWEASSEVRLRLGSSLMMPDRFNVTASRNDEGEYELETVTSWTRWGGIGVHRVRHFFDLAPLHRHHLHSAPRKTTCREQLVAWGEHIHDKRILSALVGGDLETRFEEDSAGFAPLFIGIVPEIMQKLGTWPRDGQQHFRDAPPEPDLFRGEANSDLPSVTLSLSWAPRRARYDITWIEEEYAPMSGVYLSRTSDTAGLKELLGGVGVASGGQPDRGTAVENLSRCGQLILRKSRARAEALKLGWVEDAPVEARAQSTVLLALGYLTGWPDALAGYTLEASSFMCPTGPCRSDACYQAGPPRWAHSCIPEGCYES